MLKKTVYFFLFQLVLSFSVFSSENADSLLKDLKHANDTTKINILIKLKELYRQTDYSMALQYLNQAIDISKRIERKDIKAELFMQLGHVYEEQGNYDLSVKYLNNSLQLFTELKLEAKIALLNNNLGAVYADIGKYEEASKNLFSALAYLEKTTNYKTKASTLLNIGLLYYYMSDYEKALGFYKKSLAISDSLADKRSMALCYNDIGIVYYYLGKLDLVLDYFKKSLAIYVELDDLRGQVKPLFNIGEIYISQKDYEQGIRYYLKSLRIDKILGDSLSIADSYISIGSAYADKGDFKRALKFQRMATEIAEHRKYFRAMLNAYEAMASTYEKLNDFNKALLFYKKYTSIKDTLLTREKLNAIADVRVKYETNKKDEEIEFLNKQNELKELTLLQRKQKIRTQRLQLIIGTITVIVLLVFVFVYYRLLRRYRHRANILSERNHEINQQKEELQSALNLINEHKESLEKANAEIIKSTRAKEMFLASTTHEIKTPVNIISGFTGLLFNTKIDAKQRRYLKNIKNSANNLLAMINDILTFSKIEAGKIKIERIEFNLFEVVQNYFESVNIVAGSKKINISYTIDKNIPHTLIGDPVRFQQILSNLVGNAVKFTEKNGFINTKINILAEDDNQITLSCSVTDTGIGIEKDKLERIFESFTQADNDTTRKFGGTGLGLSIVKRLVELQNGNINVKSQPGKGSTFWFEIPFSKKTDLSFSVRELPIEVDTSKTKNIKILIADDNPVNVELLRDILLSFDESIGIETVDNGQEAISKVQNGKFDLLLLDIQMPVLDGFKTIEYIRNKLQEPNRSIPVIALSAFTEDMQKEKCLKAGMNAYISKPFEAKVLFQKISTLIEKEWEAKVDIEKKSKYQLQIELELIDLNYLNKLYKNNTQKILKILNISAKEIPVQIGKLESLLYNKEYKKMQVIAHSLKTSLNYLGLKKLSENALQIEKNITKNKMLESIPGLLMPIIKNWEKVELEIKQIVNYLNHN